MFLNFRADRHLQMECKKQHIDLMRTVPARLVEDPSTDDGINQDALKRDSEKGLVKLSSV